MSGRMVLRIERDNELAWAWLPSVLRRVHAFCIKMDTETLPQEAEDLVRAWFCIGDKRMCLYVILDQVKGLVGHMFATVEPAHLDHWRYVLIRQAEVDKKIDVRAETRQISAHLDDWARSFGLDRIVMLTHRNEQVVAKRWGYVPYKTLMYRTIT